MEIAIVLVILVVAGYLFARETFSVDLVALMILGVLLVVEILAKTTHWIDPDRWISPQDGVSGFANPAVITVAAMFVLSSGLQKTGAARAVADLLLRWGKSQFVLLILMMVAIGATSAFVNNTAAVAVFLPMILAVSARKKMSASKLLIPLSFASQFGGVCTLIGTSTNLIVSAISEQQGYKAFGMFEFTRLGLILMAVGILYFVVVGYWLLPKRRSEELSEVYQLGEYITELKVTGKSSLVGKTAAETKFGQRYDATLLEIVRSKERLWAPQTEPVRVGDVLLVRGRVKNLMDLKSAWKLELQPEFKLRDAQLEGKDLVLTEALIAPNSALSGRTLSGVEFHRRYNSIVLAIGRRGVPLREQLTHVRLQSGDALLLLGPKKEIDRLRRDDNLIVLLEVEHPVLRGHKVPVALGIVAGVVLLATLGIMPIMVSSILGCIALVATQCLKLEEAYKAIDWKVIFLLAGVLPLGLALQRSGAADLIASRSVELVGPLGPTAVLAAFFVLTTVLTALMSNNATAVVLAPIAISTAIGLGVSPKPFLMAVMFAASTCFATPIGYQTNVMVYTPGNYRFSDFLKVGIPLNILFAVIAVYFIPRFWPF